LITPRRSEVGQVEGFVDRCLSIAHALQFFRDGSFSCWLAGGS
jgi:hypothetical protein